jgi:hypothetical protein
VACVVQPANTTMYLYYISHDAYGAHTNLFKAVNNVTNAVEAFSGTTRMGGDSSGGDGWTFNGFIDEVAVFTNAMTEGQVQDLFLRSIGLTSGIAPSFTLQPSNSITMYKGQTLSLTGTAGGIPSPTYQWQCLQNGSLPWVNVDNAATVFGATTENLIITGYPSGLWTTFNRTNFQLVATNNYGKAASTLATVTLRQVPQTGAQWTMNFAMVSLDGGGTGTPYSGRGVLGTGTNWNALNADSGQAISVTANRDDGVATNSGIVFSSQAGIYVNSGSSLALRPTNNMLLDTYAIIASTNSTTPFVFSNIPNGKYNLALYGCVGNWLDRAIKFTVLTNGVVAGTAAMTNLQDSVLAPNDNTAVFTNLIVMNQRLEVDMIFLPCPLHTNTLAGECEFNGAQLQLLTNAPGITVVSNQFVAWAGGGLYTATNVTGPWVTNPGVSPLLLTNKTESKRFFRVFSPTAPF